MRRMPGRPRVRSPRLPSGRAARFAALTTTVGTVAAMILVAQTNACAATPPTSSGFYVDPHSAAVYWDMYNASNPFEPAIAHRIADVPSGIWFTQYDPDRIAGQVRQITAQAAAAGTIPVLVLYDIPDVNCSTKPPNGAPSIAAYESWSDSFASGLGDNKVIVIVEPDGLSLQTCLTTQQAADRDAAIAHAGTAVHKADPNARVYFDAGNSAWNPPQVQAQRLAEADVASSADGIFSNVSNFLPTQAEVAYDEQILADLGNPTDLHIVVDTSRNGNGPGNTWCDPSGRALGALPTTDTGNSLVDAYLWIKDPGQADGCAAPAGTFDPQLAYALIANAPGGAGPYAAKTSPAVGAPNQATPYSDPSAAASSTVSKKPTTTAAAPVASCSA